MTSFEFLKGNSMGPIKIYNGGKYAHAQDLFEGCDWMRARNRDLVLEIDRNYNLKNNCYHSKSIFRSTIVCRNIVCMF